MKFNLPDPIRNFFQPKAAKRQVYLSLAFQPAVVHGAVWTMDQEGIVEILGATSQAVDVDGWEERLKSTDRVVTALEQIAGSSALSEVVLGFSDEYLTPDGDINPETKKQIGHMLRVLALKPLGYVPIDTAIVFHLRKTEGVPPSCILVHVTKTDTNVTLYSVGQKLGTKTVKTTESVVKDIESAIKAVAGAEIPPSRMLVYGLLGEDLEGFRRMLLKYPWTAKLQFLHFPKVESVPAETIAEAVVVAGASEMSQSVASGDDESAASEDETDQEGLADVVPVGKPEAVKDAPAVRQVVEVVEDEEGEHPVSVVAAAKSSVSETADDGETDESELVDRKPADELLSDSDDEEPLTLRDGEVVNAPKESDVVVVDPESLGFSEHRPTKTLQASVRTASPVPETEDEENGEEEEYTEEPRNLKERLSGMLLRVKGRFRKNDGEEEETEVEEQMPGNGKDSYEGEKQEERPGGKIIGIVVAVAIVCVVLGGLWYWFMPKAMVTLAISPKKIVKTRTLTVDPSATAVNKEKGIIPGKKIEKEESGEKTVAATGKKNVGTPAKGTITVFNKTLSSVTIKKGSVFTSGSLSFALDSDVSVASASESLSGDTRVYGKNTASLTASKIGTESNLAASSDFVSKDLGSDVTGRNDQAFTGGSSKTVTVVSRDDQNSIVTALKTELIEKAKSELSSGVDNKEKLIDATVAVSPQMTKTFSHDADGEFPDVNGKLTVTVTGIAYSEDDVKSILSADVTADVPSGFQLNPSRSTVDAASPVVKKDGSITISGSMTGIALPTIDEKSLAKRLSGKKVSDIQSILKEIPGLVSATVNVMLSPWKTILPLNASRIGFTVSVEQ